MEEYLASPASLEFGQLAFSFLGRGGVIDSLQIQSQYLALFPAHEVQAVAQQVHNAQLHLSLRVDSCDRIWKSSQPVYAGDENVLHAAVAQFGQDLQPELGSFGGAGPHTEHYFV